MISFVFTKIFLSHSCKMMTAEYIHTTLKEWLAFVRLSTFFLLITNKLLFGLSTPSTFDAHYLPGVPTGGKTNCSMKSFSSLDFLTNSQRNLTIKVDRQLVTRICTLLKTVFVSCWRWIPEFPQTVEDNNKKQHRLLPMHVHFPPKGPFIQKTSHQGGGVQPMLNINSMLKDSFQSFR